MEVRFIATQKGVLKIPCPEISSRHAIVFNRGRFRTSNKAEIRKLLGGKTTNRYVSLAPGQDLKAIDKYLSSDEQPDIMTQEFLDEIPFDAWREIIPLRSDIEQKFPLVGMAIASLVGKPMDDNIERIKAEYLEKEDGDINEKVEKKDVSDKETETSEKEDISDKETAEKDDVLEEKESPKKKKGGLKIGKKSDSQEKIDKTTADLTVRQSVDIINDGHPYEYLQDFIAEGEDRVTIQKAWNAHYPEHPVEVSE